MTIRTSIALAGVLWLTAPTASAAKRDLDGTAEADIAIEDTQVRQFDDVFAEVRGIQETTTIARERIERARVNIALAVGLTPSTSLDASLHALASRTAGQVHVVLKDGRPHLAAQEGLDPEVVRMIDLTNAAVADVALASGDLGAAAERTRGLVEATRGLPDQVNPAILKAAGLKAQELPKVSKTVTRNARATAGTPELVEAALSDVESFLDRVASFGSAAPVAVASAETEASATDSQPDPEPSVADLAPPSEEAPEAHAAETLRPQLDRAWTAYLDAETDEAASILAFARQGLERASTVPSNADIVELFHLLAAIELSLGDDINATRAIRRAATANPMSKPPESLGPDVAVLFDRWSGSIGKDVVKVSKASTTAVWIDGTEVGPKGISIPAGEHLVQRASVTGAITGERLELKSDTVIDPLPGTLPIALAPAASSDPATSSTAKVDRNRKGPNAVLLVSGSAVLAGGATAVVIAMQAEDTFRGLDYDAASYGGCLRGDACYETARDELILQDAARIRTFYIAGYSLLAVGGGLATSAFFISPAPISPGAWGLHLDGRF